MTRDAIEVRKRIRSDSQWRTMHVVVSVPVLGQLSATRLNHWIEAALNLRSDETISHGLKHGKFTAKALDRVLTARKIMEQRKERANVSTVDVQGD